MKDLYTFDADQESALRTYEEVNEIYRKLFKFIGVPFVKGNGNEYDFNWFKVSISEVYHRIQLKENYKKSKMVWRHSIVLLVVKADAKDMGGHLSHEYHYLEPIGEAKLQNCPECQSYSIDATENEEDVSECPECHAKNMEKTSGIEVRK